MCIGLGVEGEASVIAGGDYGAQENAPAESRVYVERDRGDERMGYTGLVQCSANLEALFGTARSEINFVARNSRSVDILFEKPFH